MPGVYRACTRHVPHTACRAVSLSRRRGYRGRPPRRAQRGSAAQGLRPLRRRPDPTPSTSTSTPRWMTLGPADLVSAARPCLPAAVYLTVLSGYCGTIAGGVADGSPRSAEAPRLSASPNDSGRAYRFRSRPDRSCSYPQTVPAVAGHRSLRHRQTWSAVLHTVPTDRPCAGHGHMADETTRFAGPGRRLRRQLACAGYRRIGL
jgi:hypothetical protein